MNNRKELGRIVGMNPDKVGFYIIRGVDKFTEFQNEEYKRYVNLSEELSNVSYFLESTKYYAYDEFTLPESYTNFALLSIEPNRRITLQDPKSKSVSEFIYHHKYPFGRIFTEEWDTVEQEERLVSIAVLNGSQAAHRIFKDIYINSTMENNINYEYRWMDMEKQFSEIISFEIYRRHLPTIFIYNRSSTQFYYSYVRYHPLDTTNTTTTATQINEFLMAVKEGEVLPNVRGWAGITYKLVNINYIYNNFHIMFNYLVGLFSIVLILFICIFEKQIIAMLRGGRKHKKKETEDQGVEMKEGGSKDSKDKIQ